MGLSPLTRGNPPPGRPESSGPGPIPAHAGQPGLVEPGGGHGGAYPRSRGATAVPSPFHAKNLGLSPLTRGNPTRLPGLPQRRGPIPAHAGQPSAPAGRRIQSRAYPRSRGATDTEIRGANGSLGLSPLTRGNRFAGYGNAALHGPIPAHAGQPPFAAVPMPRPRAYPRSRGATTLLVSELRYRWGLSPLTRGNLQLDPHRAALWGPIPAHAGQPKEKPPEGGLERAYPRSRGATCGGTRLMSGAMGLSPLTRGNPCR